MTVEIIKGDARSLPLDDESVDLIVTSPPYFALRSYRDGDEHYDGQIGSENSPADFIAALMECAAEWWRVIKPSGSVWVNLGDKYAGSSGSNNNGSQGSTLNIGPNPESTRAGSCGPKSLMGLPWRFAIGMIDSGWILRAEVIWSKPNGLPESVTDRVRRSHEQWFHLVKEPRYYSAVDELREPSGAPQGGQADTFARRNPSHDLVPGQHATQHRSDRAEVDARHPLGRLPGSVWTIPTEPLIIPPELGLPDHFAAFPQEWPRRLILGWSPPAICTVCEQGLRPQVDTAGQTPRQRIPENGVNDRYHIVGGGQGLDQGGSHNVWRTFSITGYSCACPEPGPTRPSVVLDPFGGTGTTAGVAHMLGRHGISVDLSTDYCRLAEWRINESGHFSKTEQRTWRDKQTSLILEGDHP